MEAELGSEDGEETCALQESLGSASSRGLFSDTLPDRVFFWSKLFAACASSGINNNHFGLIDSKRVGLDDA